MTVQFVAVLLLKLMNLIWTNPGLFVVLIGIPSALIIILVRKVREHRQKRRTRAAWEAAHMEELHAEAVKRRREVEARDLARRAAEARAAKLRAIEQAKDMIANGDMDGYEYLKEAQGMKIPEK